jgi:hypothetical protein
MQNYPLRAALVLAMAMGSSSISFAQTKPPAPKTSAANSHAGNFNPRDLSGVWMQDRPRPDKVLDRYWLYELNQEEPPMTPWGKAQYDATKSSFGTRSYPIAETNDPVYHSCTPAGFPRVFLHPFPLQIVQAPSEIIVLFEWDSVRHSIHTDGRGHDTTLGPLWMGDAIGHWDGDTLVADTTNFNTKTWLDRVGHPHSDALHVIERIRRISHGHLVDDITIDDPKAYTKPWTARLDFWLRPTWTLTEQFCEDQGTFDQIENNETKTAK